MSGCYNKQWRNRQLSYSWKAVHRYNKYNTISGAMIERDMIEEIQKLRFIYQRNKLLYNVEREETA